eukprot:jgi/Chlat1/5916/Chrsp4S06408
MAASSSSTPTCRVAAHVVEPCLWRSCNCSSRSGPHALRPPPPLLRHPQHLTLPSRAARLASSSVKRRRRRRTNTVAAVFEEFGDAVSVLSRSVRLSPIDAWRQLLETGQESIRSAFASPLLQDSELAAAARAILQSFPWLQAVPGAFRGFVNEAYELLALSVSAFWKGVEIAPGQVGPTLLFYVVLMGLASALLTQSPRQ